MIFIKSYLKSEDTNEPKTILSYGTKKFSLNESENDLIESVRSEMEDQCVPRSRNNLNLSLNLEDYEEIDTRIKQDGTELVTRIYKAKGKSSEIDGENSQVVLVFEVTGPRELLETL